VCEAAGFETSCWSNRPANPPVPDGGYSHDRFFCLMLPGAATKLQASRRAVREPADMIADHKAERPAQHQTAHNRCCPNNRTRCTSSRPAPIDWHPRWKPIPALTGRALDALWQKVLDHRQPRERVRLVLPAAARDTGQMDVGRMLEGRMMLAARRCIRSG